MSDGPNTQFDLFVGSQWRNCGLDPYEFTIFCNLKSRVNSQSKLCCPSIRTIVQETGISRRKVIYALKALETKGFMKHRKQARTDGGKASHHYVDLAHPMSKSAPPPGACGAPTQVHEVHRPSACDALAQVHVVAPKVFNLKGTQYKGKSSADALTHPLPDADAQEKTSLRSEEEVPEKKGESFSGTSVELPKDNGEQERKPLSRTSLKDPKTFSVTPSSSSLESESTLAAPALGRPGGKRTASGERPESEAEVIAYVVSRGFPPEDGQCLWSRWTGNGFRNAGQSIRDWKATINSWIQQKFLPSQKKRTEASKTGHRRNLI
jgi:hypothetical protein